MHVTRGSYILVAMATSRNPAQRLTLITLAVLALIAVGVIVYFRVAPQASPTPTASGELDVSAQPMLGQPDAPVEIAVFEDFKCPACQFFDETVMPRIHRELIDTGQARLYFFNFPFLGPDSTTAALAGECVYEQDAAAFWDFKTFVFRAQGSESQEWATPTFLSDLARDNLPGIDADTLRSCIEDETYSDRIEADREQGVAAGVQGTPSVYVDGQLLSDFQFETVQAAVENAQGN
jgi:protein-disulfide isomerase